MNDIDRYYGCDVPTKPEVRDGAWYARQHAMKKQKQTVAVKTTTHSQHTASVTDVHDSLKSESPSDEPKHIAYDGWKVFTGAPGHALLHRVVHAVMTHEGKPKYQRATDKKNYSALIRSVCANLAYLALLRPVSGTGIHLSRSKRVLGIRDRYAPQFVGEKLIPLLDTLESLDLIIQRKPEKAGRGQLKNPFGRQRRYGNQTVIFPSGRFAAWMAECMVKSLSDVDHLITEESGDEEIVLLKSKRVGNGNPLTQDAAALVQYKDNETTDGYRKLVRQFNVWFAQMVVTIENPERPSTTTGRLIDTRASRVQRIFTRERWDSVGRYFRGWWMELSKEERLERIRINGQRIAELDFSNMMVRLAYAKLKVQPPEGDQYAIPGYERSRAAMKIIFSALLFDPADFNRKRLPQDALRVFHPGELRDTQRVIGDIKRFHSGLAGVFGSGMGHDLFFDESQILSVILDTVQKRGLSALPIHDALIVPLDQEPVIREIMEESFEQRMGMKGVVKVVE